MGIFLGFAEIPDVPSFILDVNQLVNRPTQHAILVFLLCFQGRRIFRQFFPIERWVFVCLQKTEMSLHFF